VKNLRWDYKRYSMRKIISIILIGLMTVGCGKIARLERLERERAEITAEQARVDKLCREKGVWERFSNNTWTYVIGTAVFVAAVVGVGALIHHRYKKTGIPPGVEDLNGQPAEVQQEEEQYQEEEQQDPQKEHSNVITDHHEETEEEVETEDLSPEDLEDFNPPANPVQAEDPPVDVPGAILVPHGNNIPHANNNHHPVERAYGAPIRACRSIRQKPFYNPGRNSLSWPNSDQNKYNKVKHKKDLNQQGHVHN
jgi:hypothetical protein